MQANLSRQQLVKLGTLRDDASDSQGFAHRIR
jgi:hypothetical protein